MSHWRWYKTNRVLSVGDTYRKGKIIAIHQWDDGWKITVQYKTVPNRQFFVYR